MLNSFIHQTKLERNNEEYDEFGVLLTWIGAVVAAPTHRTVGDVTRLRHAPLVRYSSVQDEVHRLLQG
jgi:hypothetical protein